MDGEVVEKIWHLVKEQFAAAGYFYGPDFQGAPKNHIGIGRIRCFVSARFVFFKSVFRGFACFQVFPVFGRFLVKFDASRDVRPRLWIETRHGIL